MQQLIGRRTELAGARQRIDDAITGSGSAVVLVGDAGVGKSSLLDAIATIAGERMTVLRTRGIEDEVGFSWSGLASLIRPLVASGDVAALEVHRRRVLDASMSPVDDQDGEPPVDLYSLSLALLDLITTAAMRQPVLLLLDDLHWVDPASARALAFLARRLDREYVAMIATSRHVVVDASFASLPLATPTLDDAHGILVGHGVTAMSVRTALIDAVGTNPLLLVNSVSELPADVRRGTRPLPDPLPFPATVMDGASRRLALLAPGTRTALAAISVLSRPTPREAQRMLTEIGCSMTVLEEAERAGVIEIGEAVLFTHPTLRTSAYRSTSAPDRRRLHGLAAGGAPDPVSRAMHLAASVVGPDDDIALILEQAAEGLAHRGAAAVAAEQFVRAAQLTSDVTVAGVRRIRAAELYLDLGLIDLAQSVLGDDASGSHDAVVAHARARLLHLQERDEESCALLRASATALSPAAPSDAARLLCECLAPLVREGRLMDVLAVAAELRALRPRLIGADAARVDAISAVFAMLSGGSVADAMTAIGSMMSEETLTAAAPFVAEVIAPMLAYANRGDELGTLLDSVERSLRDRAAIVPLISVLAAQQLRNFGVNQPRAIGAGEEAIRLADEIGRPRLAMMAAFGLSVGASVAGDALAYHRAATLLASSTYPHADAARLVGLGVLHQSAGRLDQALEAWEQLVHVHGFGDPLLTFEADYLETLIRLGRVDDAAALLARFDADGTAQRSPGTMGRVRAMATDDDDLAAEHFESAITACRAGNNRIGEGRAELAWGERLRRKRRRAEARLHLERAMQLFRVVGVACWAARAETELQASGVVVDTSLPVHVMLTSQELRVARLVAGGASNREIGVELFVSQRTVETHLTSIFRKLQIKNRRELSARAVVDADLRSQASPG